MADKPADKFASLCFLMITFSLHFCKLWRDLHQHLKKSSQYMQHFLEFSFDTVSSFNFHPAWLSLCPVSV
jgi:hypothetical protein